MPGIEETLRTLRDVQGVYGSFVVSSSGALVARDLPTIFDSDLFAEVGPRVTRLYETIGSGGDELESCMLRYAEHKVYLRRMAWGVIGVLSTVAVNLPALRMVANLVIRKIDPEVHPGTPTSLLPPAPGASPSIPPGPPASPLAVGEVPPGVVAAPAIARSSSAPPPATPPRTVSRPPDRFVPPPPLAPLPPAARTPTNPPSARPIRMYRGRPVTD
jgi:predicted regulator of Ras-like GTPase activity (Roadblock/LC7/MglB family)